MFKPERPRRRRIDSIDVGFRVSGALAGSALTGFVIALTATNPDRSGEWLIVACVIALPMAATLVFALLSWAALRADRSAERAERMDIDFSPPRAWVEPVRDQPTAD